MSPNRLYKLAATLVLATFACNLILLARSILFSNDYYSFLNWNLFLAWIPFLCAALGNQMARHTSKLNPWVGLLLIIWFIFYPNAPYIMTDFLHLGGKNEFLLLFDVVTVFSYSVTGLIIGFCSLELAQSTIKKFFGRFMGWIFAMACLTLGSFGVYVGRFLRWNSWELLTHPTLIARDMLGTIVNPLLYTRLSLAFTCVLTIFCTSLYLVYHSLSESGNH